MSYASRFVLLGIEVHRAILRIGEAVAHDLRDEADDLRDVLAYSCKMIWDFVAGLDI